jgi:hypothetical protein
MNATRLPYHVSLLPGEALCSWIWRLAARFEISALHLLKGAFGVRHIDKESARHGTWWRTPERSLLDQISARTGMTTARLAKATLANWSPGAPGGEGGWGPEGRKFLGAAMARISDLIAACPRCLAENGSAYLRTTWIFQWLSCCPKHGIIMVCGCASCLARLSLPPLSSTRPWRPSCCRACGWSILDAETTPAQDCVRALQRRLLAGKRSGWIALPGFPPMAWPPFVAGLNAIAEVIWVHGKPGCRDELFALVAKEVGIEAVTPEGPPRKVGHGRVRHDAMLVLAWLLERWPDRLMTLAEIFGVARRRWRVNCSRPEPVRIALRALPWPLAHDLLWRADGWQTPHTHARDHPRFLSAASRVLLARHPHLAQEAPWLVRRQGEEVWRRRLLALIENQPHLWGPDGSNAEAEFYDLPSTAHGSLGNSTN